MTASASSAPHASSPAPHWLVRSAAIRAIEQQHLAAGVNLMERAGRATATTARAMLREATRHPAHVLVLAGPGNNGGDAFEAAVHLRRAGYRVSVWFNGDSANLPDDARAAHGKWIAAGGACDNTLSALESVDLIIDGLFGIGLKRALGAPFSDIVERVNQASQTHAVPVLALDVPSGLDADTGLVMGCAICATRTLTFIADKPGLYTLSGPDHAGIGEVATLDLRVVAPVAAPAGAPQDTGRLTTRADFSNLLRPRQRDSHKGSYGTLGIFGGARGMAGAALLAGRAALKLGAGKVFVGMLDESSLSCDPLQPELMLRPANALLEEKLSAVVIGPGLGSSAAAHQLLSAALALDLPLLLDADALNLIGTDATLASSTVARVAPTVMTPHPLEAARLLGMSTAAIQQDRIAAAQAIARRYRASVILKGAGSVVAAPNGAWWINPTGNPGMASAGMGDVLAGIAGAWLAQPFLPQPEAAKTVGTSRSSLDDRLQSLVGAVFLHGAAADSLVARGVGPVGLTASEVIDEARTLWNAWQRTLLL